MNPATALNDQERSAVSQFRKEIQDVLPLLKNDFMRHDLSLIRFLRARNLNIDKAQQLLRKHVEWRKKNNIDEILSVTLPPVMETNYPVICCGFCREGYPVVAYNAGRWDFRYALESGLKDDLMTYLERFFEIFFEFCRTLSTADKYFTEFNVLVDLDGLEMRQLTSQEVREFGPAAIEMFISNYPELLRYAWIINAPTIFQIVWAIVRPLLTDRTASKISIHGSNREKWREDWIKMVDPDNFPSQYGGAITSCMTFKFEKGFDLLNNYETFPEEELQSVVVQPGQDHSVNLELTVGSRLTWNFKTVDYDIGFSVTCRSLESEIIEIIKYTRVDSHIFLQKGTFQCEVDGMYTLTFHNFFSKFTAKALRFNCRESSDLKS